MAIYNTIGQKIRKLVDQQYIAGIHKIKWDGVGPGGLPVTGGVYIMRFEAKTCKDFGRNHFVAAKKMIYLP